MTRRVSQAIADSPVLRRIALPTYRAYTRHLRSGPGPRVLANGVPKGGTHLLTSLLDAFRGLRSRAIRTLSHVPADAIHDRRV